MGETNYTYNTVRGTFLDKPCNLSTMDFGDYYSHDGDSIGHDSAGNSSDLVCHQVTINDKTDQDRALHMEVGSRINAERYGKKDVVAIINSLYHKLNSKKKWKDERGSLRVHRSEKALMIFTCAYDGCPWKMSWSLQKDDDGHLWWIRVRGKKAEPHEPGHSSTTLILRQRKTKASSFLLSDQNACDAQGQYNKKGKNTALVMDTLQDRNPHLQRGQLSSWLKCNSPFVLEAALKSGARIIPLLQRLQGQDPQGYYVYSLRKYDATKDGMEFENLFTILARGQAHKYKPVSEQLGRFFVMSSSGAAFLECAKSVVCMDAASLKGYFGGMLYVASGFSAENNVIVLAFGICDGRENQENWTWFVKSFFDALEKCKVKPPRLILTDSTNSVDAMHKLLEKKRGAAMSSGVGRRDGYVTY